MKKNIFTLFCFSQLIFCSIFANQYIWPESETGSYEVIHDSLKKVLIPLPDFEYIGEVEKENSSIYQHVLYSHRKLFFTLDIYPEIDQLELEEFANAWTETWEEEDPSIKLIHQKEIIASTTLMLFKTFQNNRGKIHQLFFVKENHGYCLMAFCYPPNNIDKSIVDAENKYWENLMNNLAIGVEFYEKYE